MDLFLNLLPWLVDAVLQCTILLTITLILNVFFKRTSAAKRHTFLLFSTLAIPLLFLFTAILPTHQVYGFNKLIPITTESNFITSTEIGAPIINNDVLLTASEPSNNNGILRPSELPLPGINFWFVIVWIFGVILSWIRLGVGILLLSRVTTKSTETRILEVTEEESLSLGISELPQLVLLEDNAMPMTWWLGSHTLALPMSSADWPIEKLRHVIRHELAHIHRCDCQSAWLAQISLALLWFHPMAWMIGRKLYNSREASCDDIAIANITTRKNHESYAYHLLDIVASHSHGKEKPKLTLTLAMTQEHKDIQSRLNSILNEEQNRKPFSKRASLFTIPIGVIGLGFIASFSACRNIAPELENSNKISKLSSSSRIKLHTIAVEFDDPKFLKKIFDIRDDGHQFTNIMTVEGMEQILNKAGSKSKIVTLPKIITTMGKSVELDEARDFIYPSEYLPPEIPNIEEGETGIFPVTPATPTKFETRKIGFSSAFTPNLVSERSIDLKISMDHTNFLGFINYGSPINSAVKTLFGTSKVVITENRIEMPVFNSLQYEGSHVLKPGEVIAIIVISRESKVDERIIVPSEVDEQVDSPRAFSPKSGFGDTMLYFIRPEFL